MQTLPHPIDTLLNLGSLNLDTGAGLTQAAANPPRHDPHLAAPSAGVQIEGWSSPQPPRVLVIDDDDLMREMLVESLEAVGCEVTQASTTLPWMLSCIDQESDQENNNGQQQQEQAQEQDASLFDLVISDIRMPGISGLGMLENMPGDHPRSPTILITAYGDANTHERARRAGAVVVLDKPFSIESLMLWVDRVLGGAK